MADIFKRQSVDLGAIADVSGTNAATSEVADVLATPFVVRRVFVNVTTAVTTPAGALTLQWRPTPGTGTWTSIAVLTLPIAAENSQIQYNLETGDNTTTELIASYDNTSGDQPSGAASYLIGSQRRDLADGTTVVGPGGEIQLLSDGNAGAGAIRAWVEVETRSSQDNDAQTNVQQGTVA